MLWNYIGHENVTKLSYDTNLFLNEYIGENHMNNFEIAMEIYLAELLIPSFITVAEDELTCRLESFIKSYMNRKNTMLKDNPMYYFENLYVLDSKFEYGCIDVKRPLMKSLASYMLEQRYKQDAFQSDVAKSLYLQHLKINKSNEVNKAMLLDEISHDQSVNKQRKNEVYERLLHVLAVQHKEMYNLEMDRLRHNFEYKIYEEFSMILSSNARQYILDA